MNDLHQILQDYLSIRRSLGFKLEKPGPLLADFVAFVKASGSPVITSALAVAWADIALNLYSSCAEGAPFPGRSPGQRVALG